MNIRLNQTSRSQANAVAAARAAIEQEYAELRRLEPRLSRLTLNEAEAMAWESGVPHLVFPVLAEEKLRALRSWRDYQASMRRGNPLMSPQARWEQGSSGVRPRSFRLTGPRPAGRVTSIVAALATALMVLAGASRSDAQRPVPETDTDWAIGPRNGLSGS